MRRTRGELVLSHARRILEVKGQVSEHDPDGGFQARELVHEIDGGDCISPQPVIALG